MRERTSRAAPAPDEAGAGVSERLEPPGHPGPPQGWRRFAPHLLLVAGWLALLPLTAHYGNPDGPSYVMVAERWLAGDLPTAVNAYWGPLLSWAIVPLLAVGVPGLLALRVVLLVGALLTFAPLRSLCRRAGAGGRATEAVLLGVAPFLVYNALFGLYADVLMSAALLRCLDLLTRGDLTRRVGVPLRAGAWAGVAYLARAYAVPVVLLTIPIVVALHPLLDRTRASVAAAARAAVLALAALALVGGAWAATLSLTYGEPTFSTSAGFNTELVAPGSAGNPFNVRGLHDPVREDGMSAWEEPSELPVPTRSGVEEVGEPTAGDRAELAVANGRIAVGSVARRGAPLAALAVVALGWHALRRRPVPPALLGPLLAGAVAAGGLLLIIAIERYLWFPILAAVPAAAVGLEVLLRGRRRWWPAAALGLVVVMAATSVHGLLPRVGAHAEVTAAADALDEDGLSGRVATAGSWQESHLLCFRAGCDYLGRPEARDADGVVEELRAADAAYLLVWEGDGNAIDGLPEVPDDAVLSVLEVTPEGLVPTRHVVTG